VLPELPKNGMPGRVPGIHVFASGKVRETWMAGTSPAMTGSARQKYCSLRFLRLIRRQHCSGDGIGAIQLRDEALVRYLEATRIPYVKLEGADFIPDFKENVWGPHWTPEGQKDVAERVYGMLSANGVVRANSASTR
jgi:hypothetical protein